MKALCMWFLKVGAIAIAVSLPVVAIYDCARPWPEAAELLQRWPGGLRICVGVWFHGSVGGTLEGSTLITERSRSFVMLPSVFWLPNVFTVQQRGAEPIQVGHSLGDFVSLIALYASSLFGTWWLWVRKARV
jgi:hypothetical protein